MKKIISIIGFILLGIGLFAQPANPSFKSASVVVSDNFYIGANPLSSLFEALYPAAIGDYNSRDTLYLYLHVNATGVLDSIFKVPVVRKTIVTVSDSVTSLDVENVDIVNVSDAEVCAIFGFANGDSGQIINIYNTTVNNLILKDNSTGTQKLMNGSDKTITGYGGVELYFNGTYWYAENE
jgi:hypothetical protein